MGIWIPGPRQLSWPANQRKPLPESPHQAAIAPPAEEQSKRTRRTKKAED